MKIFLDGRIPGGGIGRHVRWLRHSLTQRLGAERCVIFAGGAADGTRGPAGRSLPRAAAGAVKRIVTDQHLLPRRVAKSGAEVFHSPNYLVPERLSIPAVVDCYDLTLIDHFESKKRGPMKSYERHLLLDALVRARCVVTPSEAVRRELLRRFELDPERVETIYPALPDLTEAVDETRLPVTATVPFFLSVGTIEPRKNLERLLEAHRIVWESSSVPLILAGAYGWRQRAPVRSLRESGGAVYWSGWVPDDVLGALYRRASAVVQPSLAEGFDLPVLEALAAGAPVVLSDLAVHREVAGDLGLYAPADEVEALAARMREALEWDGQRRARHHQRATARVEALGRRSGIERYLEVYRRALTLDPGPRRPATAGRAASCLR